MKKFYSIIILAIMSITVFAQDDSNSNWTRVGDFSLNFNQVNFSNWAAGGENSVSGVTLMNYDVSYDNGKSSWKNKFILGYGLQYLSDDYKKTEDKIDLSSLYGYKIGKNWDASFNAFLKTQFAEGFDGDNDSVAVSKFMAPGYIGFGPGFTYKPVEYFTAFISPATVQFVVVNDQRLADEGAFGVTPAVYDTAGVKISDGEMLKTQFGASMKLAFKKDIAKNVNLETTVELFSDYLNKPQNIIVRWDMIIDMAVNSWLSAKLTTGLIYDDNIIIKNAEGNNLGPRTQFKEMFGLGLGIKF